MQQGEAGPIDAYPWHKKVREVFKAFTTSSVLEQPLGCRNPQPSTFSIQSDFLTSDNLCTQHTARGLLNTLGAATGPHTVSLCEHHRSCSERTLLVCGQRIGKDPSQTFPRGDLIRSPLETEREGERLPRGLIKPVSICAVGLSQHWKWWVLDFYSAVNQHAEIGRPSALFFNELWWKQVEIGAA